VFASVLPSDQDYSTGCRGVCRVGKYFPYGQERPSATTDGKEKFATYFRDSETGLDYADQRYHQPGMGRFMTPDSYGGSASQKDPRSWNKYAYTEGDPINFIDPRGALQCACGPQKVPAAGSSSVIKNFQCM
jgi:RHS repeat-associated protein